jgi:hypothetical protein
MSEQQKKMEGVLVGMDVFIRWGDGLLKRTQVQDICRSTLHSVPLIKAYDCYFNFDGYPAKKENGKSFPYRVKPSTIYLEPVTPVAELVFRHQALLIRLTGSIQGKGYGGAEGGLLFRASDAQLEHILSILEKHVETEKLPD